MWWQRGRHAYDHAFSDDVAKGMLMTADTDDQKDHQKRMRSLQKLQLELLAKQQAQKNKRRLSTDSSSDESNSSNQHQPLRTSEIQRRARSEEDEQAALDAEMIAPEGQPSQEAKNAVLDADGSDGEHEYSQPDPEASYQLGPAVQHLVKNADNEPLGGTSTTQRNKHEGKQTITQAIP